MLLASQRFGASGMLRRDEIFSQIALRIAMKIAQAEVATLTEFQRAGKEAINALDGPGKVVINDRSGQDGYNVAGIVSLLKGEARERFVQELAGPRGATAGRRPRAGCIRGLGATAVAGQSAFGRAGDAARGPAAGRPRASGL